MPTYPGGDAALVKFIQSNLAYPTKSKKRDISGKVFVRFLVQADGSVDQVTVVRSVAPDLDKAAMEVVKKMPKWNPGKEKGKAVPVLYNLPINFVLN